MERLIVDYLNLSDGWRKGCWQNEETYNICSGIGTSIGELIMMIRDLGLQLMTVGHNRRPGDPAYLIGDPRKTHEIFGKPYPLTETMKSAVNWQKYKDEHIDY